MNKIELLLSNFETLSVSQDMKEDLAIQIEEPWFAGIFTGWVHRRLNEGIGNLELLTLIAHFDPDKNPKLGSLGSIINSVIIGDVLLRHKSHGYLLYLIQHDKRNKNNLLKETLKHLSHTRNDIAISLIKSMSTVLDFSLEEMIVDFLEVKSRTRSISPMLSLDVLEDGEQLRVIATACRLNRTVFDYLVVALEVENLLDVAIKRAHDMMGADELSQALLVTEIPIDRLQRSQQLTNFLVGAGKYITPTIKHLLQRAELEKHWDYVLKLASGFHKKEILKILLKAKDPILIDKFFFLYKDYPEVKNLTPFL